MFKNQKLNIDKILNDNTFVKDVVYMRVTSSTNNVGKTAEIAGNTLFFAEKQKEGRGRMGKDWHSGKGKGICMSVVTLPEKDATIVTSVTLASALAVCETLNNMFSLDAKIKWPNDVVVKGKKICGILTECITESNIAKRIVTGIGINVNNKKFPPEIRDIATSLYVLSGEKQSREDIIANILKLYEKYYTIVISDGFEKLLPLYKNLCVNLNREVEAFLDGIRIQGTVTDITENGELIVQKKDGTTVRLNSGDVSVRGIYGYI